MISIIICTYNRDKYIKKCLDSFITQSLSFLFWELVIVNNNSTDSTDHIIKDYIQNNPKIKINYVIETCKGLSYARNRGIRESNGEFIIFIDDDSFIIKDYLKYVNEYLKEMPSKFGFGGKIKPFVEVEYPKWMSKYLASIMSIIDLGDSVKLFPYKKYPIGANMGFSKNVINEIGCFNENLGRTGNLLLAGEEKDFFLRMRNLNIPIYYLPKMLLYHVIPQKRLTTEFVKNQAIGIGISERLRTRNIGKLAYFNRCFMELYKWGATLILFLIYSLQLTPSKGTMLIKFRWWITSGLINFSKT